MSIDLDAAFENYEGLWYFDTSIDFECLCGGAFTINASRWAALSRLPTYVRIFGNPQYVQGPPAPYGYIVNREILDQFRRPLERVMFVNESFSPDPPNGTCTASEVSQGDQYSDEGGTFSPDTYSLPGNAPDPCESTSTQSFVIDGHAVITTYSITWRFSGVTVQPNNEP